MTVHPNSLTLTALCMLRQNLILVHRMKEINERAELQTPEAVAFGTLASRTQATTLARSIELRYTPVSI